MKTGIELIAEERARQVSAEGWTSSHDDHHSTGDLAMAAAVYASIAAAQGAGHPGPFAENRAVLWPWEPQYFKPKDQLRNLVRAGALIAAEIDRLQRESSKGGENDK